MSIRPCRRRPPSSRPRRPPPSAPGPEPFTCIPGTRPARRPSTPNAVLAAVEAVRAAVPATPVGVTTGLWVAGGDPARRMAQVSRWTGNGKPDFASVNLSEPGADELAGLLGELGIAVEAGVWSVADADQLAASELRWPRAADPD